MRSDSAVSVSGGARWTVAMVAVVLGAVALRAVVNLGGELPPGVDAAYYPLQTRSLLEQGRLAYHDLPLLFAVQGAVARGLMSLTGMGIDEATLLASRLVDCVTAPLIGIAVFAVGRVWLGRRPDGSVLWAVSAAAVFATMSFPLVRMVSDFQKNSLGLVWLAAAVWAGRWALARGGWERWGWWGAVAGFVALAAVTHVGALGATVITVGALIAAAVLLGRGGVRLALAAGVLGAALGAVLLVLVHAASPDRARDLLRAPMLLVGTGGERRPPGVLALAVAGIVYPVGLIALARLRREAVLETADRAVIVGCAVAGLVLACPLMNGEYLSRFALMAPVPAAFPLAYVLGRVGGGRRVGVAASLVLGISALSGMAAAAAGLRPVMPPDAARELRAFRAELSDPSRTLMVARHGVQWWAGYLLHTPVRAEIPADAFERYRRVLVLSDTFDRRRPPREGGGRPGGPPGDGPLRGVRTPPGSRVVRAGAHFTIYEAPSPGP